MWRKALGSCIDSGRMWCGWYLVRVRRRCHWEWGTSTGYTWQTTEEKNRIGLCDVETLERIVLVLEGIGGGGTTSGVMTEIPNEQEVFRRD
jgi:hypothetical protein